MKLFRVIKEIKNYFFIGRTLRKASKTEKWKEFKLRRGWFNVAYTVINLPPEVYESEEIYYRTYVIEQLAPINEFFKDMNMSEVVSVEVEDILDKEKGVFAFLVKYEPLFKDLSLWLLIKWSALLLLIWWAFAKFHLLGILSTYIDTFITWVKI